MPRKKMKGKKKAVVKKLKKTRGRKSNNKTKKTKKIVKASKKVLAIPKGYHSITPYLIVEQGADAIDFYKTAFGAKEVMRIEKSGGKIGHAELKIGDARIMLADEFPEMGANSPAKLGGTPVSIHLYVKNVDGIVAKAVSAGARLARPVETMFYGDRSATVEDPYGHRWYVSTHVENVSLAKIKKRAADMMGKKTVDSEQY